MKSPSLLSVAILLVAVFNRVQSKQFNKCSLATELSRLGVPKSELPDWVCLVQHESNFKTNWINKKNSNGSWDFGLFQINDKWWCQGHIRSHNTCNVKCEELVTEDIEKALECAKVIKRERGYKAWYGWLNNCQNKKPSVDECF